MIHGTCCDLNRPSPCIADEKCTKSFPKDFTNDTSTNVDGYPIYRRENTDNGGQSFTLNIYNADIDNRWVVLFSPLLSKTFNAPQLNDNDGIMLFQIGRYVSSNEAVWRIFGFPIHERDRSVTHLAVHL